MNDPRSSYWDKAAQDARQRKASWMTTNEPLSARDVADIVAAVRDHMREHDVSNGALAKALGVSETYVSNLFSNRDALPAATLDKLVRGANNWMEEDFTRRAMRRPDNFVNTAVAKLIHVAATRIKAARLIGIVTGPAGIGKTFCARAFCADSPGSMYVYVDDDARGARDLLDRIHAAARVRSRRKIRRSMGEAVERLRDSGRLLVIDQAHDLRDAAFRTLMNLHDQTGIPIMLLGTRDIHERLADDRDPEFGQMSSRVGFRVDLLHELMRAPRGGQRAQWIKSDEIRRIFQHKLKLHPEAVRMLVELANFHVGHLRRVGHVVRLAEVVALAGEREQITADDIRAALRLVAGHDAPLPPTPPAEDESERRAASA